MNMQSLDKAYGKRIIRARQESAMSQRALVEQVNEALDINWHQTTLSKVESGERPLRLHEAAALDAVLGTGFIGGHSSNPVKLARISELRTLETLIQKRLQQLSD